jgi:hypothetical protein
VGACPATLPRPDVRAVKEGLDVLPDPFVVIVGGQDEADAPTRTGSGASRRRGLLGLFRHEPQV